MANGDIPDHRDLWDAVNQSRLELAELKGMIKMHGFFKMCHTVALDGNVVNALCQTFHKCPPFRYFLNTFTL